jgi:hypothetical protein
MNKFRYWLLVAVFWVFAFDASAQHIFSLGDVINRAQSESPAFKQTETRRENRYWQYQYYRTNYVPQIRLNSNNAGALYNNSFNWTQLDDGTFGYLPVNYFNPGVNLSLHRLSLPARLPEYGDTKAVEWKPVFHFSLSTTSCIQSIEMGS